MDGEMSLTRVALSSLLRTVANVRERGTLGCEAEVKDVEVVISTIKNLLDEKDTTEAALTSEGRDCFRSLTEVIYEAEDMFDELISFDVRKQGHVKTSEKIINMFTRSKSKSRSRSRSKFLSPSSNSGMHREVNRVRKKWEDVSAALKKLELPNAGNRKMSGSRSEETFPQLYAPGVIGRKSDLECITSMILPSVDDLVIRVTRFVSVVGVGGLGKTTVAQLVFNDAKVVAAFPLKIWIFVGLDCNFDDIREKIEEPRKQMPEETTLVVLDDVWSENEDEIKKIKELLTRWGNGSYVLSTTRSRTTAKLMADSDCVYELKGLSEEDSWRLLQTTAFDRGQEPEPQLVEIGRNITAKCCNVPLALKVVGWVLYCQDMRKWLALSTSFDDSIYGSDDILPLLKLSYDNLESPLKCCFALCALFPKGYNIPKELLISLWMSQDYVEPPPITDDSTEDVAERYFNTLLQRCFFQDVKSDEYGDVVSFRIHDLMYDLAQRVAGENIGVAENLASMSSKISHVFHDRKEVSQASLGKMNIRTYLKSDFNDHFPVATLVENCMSLRALSLHNLNDVSLPESIGTLIHLRYLDLSRNKLLEMLPSSLTKLCNLETLDLRDCFKLTRLPSDLSELVLLRRLDITGCEKLTCMPSNMNNMNRLRSLTQFVVDDEDSSGKLGDLKPLRRLKGCIEILIPADYTVFGRNEDEGGFLRKMTHLKAVCIKFQNSADAKWQSAVLEKLQPHQNLKGLTLKGCLGSAPHWTVTINTLVKLELRSCKGLIDLPFISKLESLKSLILDDLENMKCIEDANTDVSPGSNDLVFFPSLEYLNISGLPKFENWWGKFDDLDKGLIDSFKKSRQFLRLYHLNIQSCPMLASFPLCPKVEKLFLMELNPKLFIFDLSSVRELKLKELEIDNIEYLKSKSVIKYSIELQSLTIRGRSRQGSHMAGQSEHSTTSEEDLDGNIKDNSEEENPWRLLEESLRTLEIDSMETMMNLPEGMQHLTISHCAHLKVIPEWLGCLATLETLCIKYCPGLKMLPESMRKLTSLRHLEIKGHTYLQKRCETIHGEDWPKIQHIRSFQIQ